MLLADIELFHSRPIAPTRRLVVGDCQLPTEPSPGAGSVLLGGVAAKYVSDIDSDMVGEIELLMGQLQAGRQVVQPRVKYRLQTDRIGLLKSRHCLVKKGGRLGFEFSGEHGAPAVHVLAAVYAAGRLPTRERSSAMETIRKGLKWRGDVGSELIGYLSGQAGSTSWSVLEHDSPVDWALEVLGIDASLGRPDDKVIQRQFREALKSAHPDHGGSDDDAAARIADITEARRILLPK